MAIRRRRSPSCPSSNARCRTRGPTASALKSPCVEQPADPIGCPDVRMRMGHVEVVVRLAGDLIDVVELPAGAMYWLGTSCIPAVAGTERTVGLATVTVRSAGARKAVPRPAIEARPY